MTFTSPSIAPTSRTTRTIDVTLEILLITLLIVQPALFGPVDAWSEWIGLCIGGAMAILLALRPLTQSHTPRAVRCLWPIALPVLLFLLLIVAQLISWPGEWVKALAPHTFAVKRNLLDDLPNAHAALASMAFSFYALATRHDLRVILLAVTVLSAVLTIHRDRKRMIRLMLAITLIAGAIACLAIAQDLSGTDKIYWHVPVGSPARSGTFINHSNFGQFMNLSIGVALALLMMLLVPAENGRRNRWARWIAAAAVGAIIAVGWSTIALSLTRGGIISAVAAALFCLITLMAQRRLRALSIVLLFVVVVAGTLLWHFGAEPVLVRMQSTDAQNGRLQTNADILQMAAHFPLWGMGLGTFQWTFPGYDHSMSLSTAAYADNDYLQALAEVGWVGVVLIFCFVAMIGWHWLRALRSGSRATGVAAIGLGYGLLAVMIQSLSDFGQHLPANACLSAVTCGLLINLGAKSRAQAVRPKRGGAILLLLVVAAIACGALLDAERARRGEAEWIIVRRLARSLETDDWTSNPAAYADFQSHAATTIAAEPGNVHTRYWLAVYHWRRAVRQFDRNSPELLQAAHHVVDQLNDARALCPTYAPLYTMLGQIEYRYLDQPIGTTHIQTGALLDRNDPTAWFAAGRSDAERGRFASANDKFRHALHLDYTRMTDITDFYLDELHEPQHAVALAEGFPYNMLEVGNALMRRAEYAAMGSAEYRHGQALAIEQAKLHPTAQNMTSSAFTALDMGKPADAEEFFTLALKLDAAPVACHAGRAEALIQLKRWGDADQEIDWLRLHHPDAAQLPDLVKRFDAARAAN